MTVPSLFSLSALKRRTFLIISVIVYIIVFSWAYKVFCAPVYASYGLSYHPTPWSYFLSVSWAVCIIPALWMPTNLRRPSQLLFLVLYFFIFIPSTLIVYHVSNPEIPPDEALILVLLMFCGFSIIQSVYLLPLVRMKRWPMNVSIFWFIFSASLLLLFAYILITLWSSFRLSNLEEIYDVRSATAATVEASGTRIGFYALMWLGGFFLPFCFAVGSFSKRLVLVFIALLGYLILFGLQGNKTTLLAPVFLLAVYLWLSIIRKNFLPALAWGFSSVLALPIFLGMIMPEYITKWYIAIVHFRTFTIPSLMFFQHYDFFQRHPLTYMSHAGGFNLFYRYPYTEGIPKTIGNYFYGIPIGANATFWASDGLAGFGLPGIILMSILCAMIFWIIDTVSKPYDYRFVMVAMTFIATSFLNVSLFTTLLSGGLLFLIGTLFILPNKGLLRCAFRWGGNRSMFVINSGLRQHGHQTNDEKEIFNRKRS